MADLEGLHVGEYGKNVELYCRKEGVIQDLSAYSTSVPYAYTVKFWSSLPHSNGIVKFSCSSEPNKHFDRAGMWQGQIWIVNPSGGTRIKSDKFSILVGE